MSSSLVIVESPAKAKTIGQVLGKGYIVEASYGHIRDLPAKAEAIPAKYKKLDWARLGVNVEDEFKPIYVIPEDKKKYVKRLKDAMAKADAVLLATDEDREGESISWHVVEVLKPKVPVHRIAFHEITTEAIQQAVAEPRQIDEDLVRAQESRRILDRLFGYMLSPVLWKRVRRGLSAGRVQSVAVRLCVLRERERRAFVVASYWDADATFEVEGARFTAGLARVGEQSVSSGQDFDADTGRLKEGARSLWLETEADARALLDRLQRPFTVTKVEKKPYTRRPAPPFTTSSMQQEANRKLRFSAQRTMRTAQRLYEGIDLGSDRVGLITYMRTDSVTLADKALGETQEAIRKLYGEPYAKGPRRYKTKTVNAQEAHEAIRPTDVSRTPESMARYLAADEAKLYELIWKRTLASQMADAELERTSVEVQGDAEGDQGPAGPAIFTASGKTIRFPGFLRAYVEGSDDPTAEIADQEVVLPPLETGQKLNPVELEARGHETSPPARYTEASLVKKLEAEGIGRPSTYASIVETIQDRGYVEKQGNALVPTFTAMAVTQLLEEHFAEYVDIQFTRKMEHELDDIAEGRVDYREQLKRIYFGNGSEPGLEKKVSTEQDQIEYPEIEIGKNPETGAPLVVKVGRYGPYLQCGTNGDRVMASIPAGVAPADFTVDEAMALLLKKLEGPRQLGTDPETGMTVFLLNGRYGSYVQLGETPEGKNAEKPKRASLPKGTGEDDVTLELALKWLSLPRTVGMHPDSGEPVLATNGRFGPHLRCDKETRSLETEEQIFTITLEQALAKLAEPKRRRNQRVRTVLKELGTDPDEETPVQLLDGPYGPYLTNGALNASLPKDQSVDSLDLERALQILAERGKAPKRRAAKTAKTTKKKTTKKKATKKKVAKRKTTKKASTRKAAAKKA